MAAYTCSIGDVISSQNGASRAAVNKAAAYSKHDLNIKSEDFHGFLHPQSGIQMTYRISIAS